MLIGFCFVSNKEHFSHIHPALEEENLKELQEPKLALKINIVIFILHRGLPYIDIHLHFELIPDFLYCLNPLCSTMKQTFSQNVCNFCLKVFFFSRGCFQKILSQLRPYLNNNCTFNFIKHFPLKLTEKMSLPCSSFEVWQYFFFY